MIYKAYTCYIYGRLRSASGLKSVPTPQIGIHWRHCLKSQSNLRVYSQICILSIISDLCPIYWLGLGLEDKSVTSLTSFWKIENQPYIWEFEKRTLIWATDVCDVEIGHGFEDWTSIRDWTSIWVFHIYYWSWFDASHRLVISCCDALFLLQTAGH